MGSTNSSFPATWNSGNSNELHKVVAWDLIIMSHDLVWDFQPTVYWQQDFSLYVSTVDTEPSPMMKRQ